MSGYEEYTRDESEEQTQLQKLNRLAEELRAKRVGVARLEAQLKREQKQLEELETVTLPEAMDGVAKFTTESGVTIELKKRMYASIPKDPKLHAAAFRWLRDNGHEGLIKRQVVVEFGRGHDDDATELAGSVREMDGANVQDKESVPYQTLGKFVRELMEEGEEVPDCITTFEKTKVHIS